MQALPKILTKPMQLLRSLKFQMAIALLGMIALFLAFGLHTLDGLQQQRAQSVLLRLAGELQATAQQMAMQAMHYEQNSPADSATYARDLRLYYQDLMQNTQRFDALCKAFSSGDFQSQLQMHEPVGPMIGEHTRKAAKALERQWKEFLRAMRQAMGSEHMPELSRVARVIVRQNPRLLDATRALLEALDQDIQQQSRDTLRAIQLALVSALIIALVILWWFYRRVLKPLDHAAEGFRQAAAGNFRFRIPVRGHSEIDLLSRAYNHLAGRLDALFELTTHLHQGSDLNETLQRVSRSFPRLMPLDWVGVLFVYSPDQAHLEHAWNDGQPEKLEQRDFPLRNTLLQRCLNQGQPLHIPDIQEVLDQNPGYRFLQTLIDRGRRDAIFLPVTGQSPVPGVLVFATRKAHAYQAEHLQLLSNLATVITLSFGKTLKLAEHARLAAIGQFATTIAHEIRTPLATVSFALDYFHGKPLPDNEAKRLQLAEREMQRINRLLEDILLYAKPLQLENRRIELCALLQGIIDNHQNWAEQQEVAIKLDCKLQPCWLLADSDRLTQVFINLLRNAVQAAPPHSPVLLAVARSTPGSRISIRISNATGQDIQPTEQWFEPFFTTRSQGTGLGLAITKRLVEAHSGHIHVRRVNDRVIFEVLLPQSG